MTRDTVRLCQLSLVFVLAVVLGACANQRGARTPARNTSSTIPVMQGLPAPGAPATAAAAASPPPTYTFSAGDELDLRVPDAPQFDQTLKVRPDGKFSLALLGTVQAVGRTPEQVEADLRQRLQRLAAPSGTDSRQEYLLQANDDIELKFPLHTALNEVVKLRPDGKIQLQMIGTVHAAGLSPEGLREVLLQRYARVLRNPDVTVLLRNATTQNVKVAGGTARAGLYNLQPTVIVRSFQPPQVFVGGEVLRPGTLAWRPGLTVLQALAEAGWYLPSAELTKLMVLRRTADNRSELLRPDFGPNLNGEQRADVALQPFDVVLLPKNSAASLAESLNLYLFNLFPPLRNSSLGFSYVLRDPNNN